MNMSWKISFQSIFNYLILLLCLTGVISLQKLNYFKLIESQANKDYFQEEENLKVKLDVQKNMPSFGFNNLVADWTFLNFIQYYGDGEAREKTGYSLVTEYFETIVESDPRFIDSYFILSTANSMFAGKPDKSVTLMQEVIDSISPDIYPKSYFVENGANFLWTYKGIDESLFLGDTKAARHSYEMAAKWASLREDEIGNTIAERANQTANFLATNPDSIKVQVSAWLSVLSNTPDEQTRNYVINKLKSLGVIFEHTEDGRVQVILPK